MDANIKDKYLIELGIQGKGPGKKIRSDTNIGKISEALLKLADQEGWVDYPQLTKSFEGIMSNHDIVCIVSELRENGYILTIRDHRFRGKIRLVKNTQSAANNCDNKLIKFKQFKLGIDLSEIPPGTKFRKVAEAILKIANVNGDFGFMRLGEETGFPRDYLYLAVERFSEMNFVEPAEKLSKKFFPTHRRLVLSKEEIVSKESSNKSDMEVKLEQYLQLQNERQLTVTESIAVENLLESIFDLEVNIDEKMPEFDETASGGKEQLAVEKNRENMPIDEILELLKKRVGEKKATVLEQILFVLLQQDNYECFTIDIEKSTGLKKKTLAQNIRAMKNKWVCVESIVSDKRRRNLIKLNIEKLKNEGLPEKEIFLDEKIMFLLTKRKRMPRSEIHIEIGATKSGVVYALEKLEAGGKVNLFQQGIKNNIIVEIIE